MSEPSLIAFIFTLCIKSEEALSDVRLKGLELLRGAMWRVLVDVSEGGATLEHLEVGEESV